MYTIYLNVPIYQYFIFEGIHVQQKLTFICLIGVLHYSQECFITKYFFLSACHYDT